MNKKASDATKVARAEQTPEAHRDAMKQHRVAALTSDNDTAVDHHTRMAETHRTRARELELKVAHATVEHHTKMAEAHERAAGKNNDATEDEDNED